MRDTILLTIFVLGALYALRQPWIGAVMSVWISLGSPHVEFGFAAAHWPVAMIVAVGTLLGLAVTRDRQNPFVGAPVWVLMAFWLWLCITLPFSMYFEPSLKLWERSMKIFVLIVVTLALINDRRKLDTLIIVIVVSLGFYGVKGGLFTLASGGSFRVWGPPGGFVEGNNELALALVMLLPMVRYLHMQSTNKWARLAAIVTMALLPITVLGSHSRGALIALSAMAFFLWLKGDKKVMGGILLVTLGLAALSFMPEHWWARMETITTYQADASAMGRINAWWNAWNLAKDNLFGGGFSIYYAPVFARYAPVPDDIHAAHSIYFQVLGEHGFVGLFLFCMIAVATWFTCQRLIRQGRTAPEHKWAADLGVMIQVSMIGFAAGGAFLSLAYFDLPYYQLAIAVLALRIVERNIAQPARAAGAAPAVLDVALPSPLRAARPGPGSALR